MVQVLQEQMRLPEPDLEELLADAIEIDRREQKGRLKVITVALELGEVLTKARSLTGHGYWNGWLEQTGIPRQRAHERIQLWGLGLSAEAIHEAGGIRAVLRANAKPREKPAAESPTVAALRRELSEVEAGIKVANRTYYDALSLRKKLLRQIKKAEREEQMSEVRTFDQAGGN